MYGPLKKRWAGVEHAMFHNYKTTTSRKSGSNAVILPEEKRDLGMSLTGTAQTHDVFCRPHVGVPVYPYSLMIASAAAIFVDKKLRGLCCIQTPYIILQVRVCCYPFDRYWSSKAVSGSGNPFRRQASK